VNPRPPRPGPGRPRKGVPVETIDDGLEDRLRVLIGRTVTAAEARLTEYEDIPTPTPEQTASVMKTGIDCGVLLGHIRRHTESVRSAGRKLSMGIVGSWIDTQDVDTGAAVAERALTRLQNAAPDVLGKLLEDFGEGKTRSVLS
jgi:hypothetical protein